MTITIFRNREAEILREEIRRLTETHSHDRARFHDYNDQWVKRLEEMHQRQLDGINCDYQEVQRLHERLLAESNAALIELRYEALRERTELKKAHAEELNRVIEDNQKLKDDMDRLRLLLTPALQNVELPKERTAPPSPSNATVTGTPWQRVLKREAELQEENPRLRRAFDAVAKQAAAKGESHGSTSEGRVDASLGGESKPA